MTDEKEDDEGMLSPSTLLPLVEAIMCSDDDDHVDDNVSDDDADASCCNGRGALSDRSGHHATPDEKAIACCWVSRIHVIAMNRWCRREDRDFIVWDGEGV